MSEFKIGAVLIAGPTASGKSALGVKLAQGLDGVVINADSMQVYRDLRIITARPTPEEEAEAPHRLYGHVDAAVNFSVGRYVADAIRMLQDIQGLKLPIFVGGTGLYFKALTEGLSDMPPVPEEVREQVRRESEGLETPELHRLLSQRDPAQLRSGQDHPGAQAVGHGVLPRRSRELRRGVVPALGLQQEDARQHRLRLSELQGAILGLPEVEARLRLRERATHDVDQRADADRL